MSQLKLLFITFFLLFSTVARTLTFAERNFPLKLASTQQSMFVSGSSVEFEHLSPLTNSHPDTTAKRGATAMAKLFFEMQPNLSPAPAAAMIAFLSRSQFPASHIVPTPSRPPAA